MWLEIHTELVPLWLEEVSRYFAFLPLGYIFVHFCFVHCTFFL